MLLSLHAAFSAAVTWMVLFPTWLGTLDSALENAVSVPL